MNAGATRVSQPLAPDAHLAEWSRRAASLRLEDLPSACERCGARYHLDAGGRLAVTHDPAYHHGIRYGKAA